jgi:hypothetical protein
LADLIATLSAQIEDCLQHHAAMPSLADDEMNEFAHQPFGKQSEQRRHR